MVAAIAMQKQLHAACSCSCAGVVLLISCLMAPPPAQGFYLPGVAPTDYENGDLVPMEVNKITSVKTQIPYDYYSLPFCKPEKIEDKAGALGQILAGDGEKTSLYEIEMKNPDYCKILCRRSYSKEEAELFQERIQDDYRVNWIIDNLPGAVKQFYEDSDEEFRYERGYLVGIRAEDEAGKNVHYVYNHVRFILSYHEDPTQFKGSRVVAFELEPFSVKHTYETWNDKKTILKTCNDGHHVEHTMEPQTVDVPGEIVWTYDVQWVENKEITWATRWDIYLQDAHPNDDIHWFSIVNSLMMVLFLTGMVAMIMMRTLHRDIARYNEEATADDVQEETGWKLVHGDVFRPPPMDIWLAALVGSGVQIAMMVVVLMGFAVLGFLSPANRGGIMTAMLLSFVFMGSFAGYNSARVYKMFLGKSWKSNTLITAFMYPSVCFGTFFVNNLFLWGKKSSGAVPFGTLIALCALWFCISVPLVFLGSYFGFKKDAVELPVKTNQIPRQIPEQPWYLNTIVCIFVGGILPYGTVFIELFFIMSAVWLHQIYYVFGFLLIVLIIMVLTCSEITIVMCYFQLCSEDYNWCWRAFLTSGSSAFYLYAYSFLYFFSQLDVDGFAGGWVYFGYMFIISFTFFILTGAIGFYSCLWFTRTIYGAIKVD